MTFEFEEEDKDGGWRDFEFSSVAKAMEVGWILDFGFDVLPLKDALPAQRIVTDWPVSASTRATSASNWPVAPSSGG